MEIPSELQHVLRLLVPGKLAFLSSDSWTIEYVKISADADRFNFISSDLHMQYFPFGLDFGPVNLAVVHRFCTALASKLAREDGRMLVYCFEEGSEDRANACFLLGAFLMLHFGRTAQEASAAFSSSECGFSLQPFRDCTRSSESYELLLGDCLEGLARACELEWFSLKTFDAKAYLALGKAQGGDIHEICPKFVAFKGPLSANHERRLPGEVAHDAAFYGEKLRGLGVTCVVRLNEADTYDKGGVEAFGIEHRDLYFDDCSCPPDEVVSRFQELCEGHARVAVHCRAGLGRTGTMIALWMMKHAGFGAAEAIAWLRIVRPGSVIGEQQDFLAACERRGWCGSALGLPRPASSRQLSRASTCCLGSGCMESVQEALAEVARKSRWSSRSSSVSSEAGREEGGDASLEALAAQVTADMCARSAAIMCAERAGA